MLLFFFSIKGKFSVIPTILATADHVSSAYKHDAASLWIENATSTNFYICLRELQNYDGFHEEIFVVREMLICNIIIKLQLKKRKHSGHSTSFNLVIFLFRIRQV